MTKVAEKKPNDQRSQALSDYAKRKNEETIRQVNRVIDELHERDVQINFETVAKLAGVSRGTLYNNEELRDRIQRLRAGGTDQMCDVLKEKNRRQEERLRALRKQVKCLEEEKQKLLVQLLDHEELRLENERLRNLLEQFYSI